MAISDILSSLGGGKPKSKTVDFSGAYRDSTRGMTLKALQQRQRELQEASARAMAPRQIGHPLQGVAQIADVISSGIREGRAADQEAAGRARFAELLAGGLAPDEIGEAMGLDPETAMKYQERTWAQEDRKEERGYTEGRDLLKHGWDVDAQTAEVKARQAEAAQRAGTESAAAEEAAREADKAAERNAALATEEAQLDAAVKSGAMTPEQADAQRELSKRKAEAEIAKGAPEVYDPVTPEIAAQWGGAVQANPELFKVNRKAGEPELITPYNAGADAQKKALFESKNALGSVDTALNELTKAVELAPQVFPFGKAGETLADWSAYAPDMLKSESFQKQADATKRFFQLTQSGALLRMASELKGSTALGEIERYIKIYADPETSVEVKKQAAAAILNQLRSKREILREQLKSQGDESTGDWTYTDPDELPEDVKAAVGAGGGGAAAPVAPMTEEDFNKKYPPKTR